jgi:hypothetical protein
MPHDVYRTGAILLAVFFAATGAAAQDFTDLFAENDLSGWIEMGEPGAFEVHGGVLELSDPRNHPNWLRSERSFENFVLELEYQPLGWAEGGIYLHAPLHGDPVASGLKIHLRHDRTEVGPRSTGALYDMRAPLVAANIPGDAWNHLRVEMAWPGLRVWMNDTLIQDVHMERDEALRHRLRSGHLGFEDTNTRFRFRNVRIRELPPAEQPWTDLFNGRDLSGWEAGGEAGWTVRDGVLEAGGGDGELRTEATFGAFELQTYFRTSAHANGGIFYRLMDRSDGPSHYEVQIYNVPTATNPTGSIYGIVPAADGGCRSGDWCLLQLISDGSYSRVLINGVTVAESDRLVLPDTGRIAIQNHSQGTIEYKHIRLKSLRE